MSAQLVKVSRQSVNPAHPDYVQLQVNRYVQAKREIDRLGRWVHWTRHAQAARALRALRRVRGGVTSRDCAEGRFPLG